MRSCCTSSLMISIHALREEGDFRFVWEIWMVIKFLSTPSARRATNHVKQLKPSKTHFYPRPPRGGRRGLGSALVK